jgi:hypothetical protein
MLIPYWDHFPQIFICILRRECSQRLLTDWAFQWGQWITHDIDLTNNGQQFNQLFAGGPGDFRIPIEDPNDPLGPTTRSLSIARNTTR